MSALSKAYWGEIEGSNMNKGLAGKMRRMLGETFQWWGEGADEAGSINWGPIGQAFNNRRKGMNLP